MATSRLQVPLGRARPFEFQWGNGIWICSAKVQCHCIGIGWSLNPFPTHLQTVNRSLLLRKLPPQLGGLALQLVT